MKKRKQTKLARWCVFSYHLHKPAQQTDIKDYIFLNLADKYSAERLKAY